MNKITFLSKEIILVILGLARILSVRLSKPDMQVSSWLYFCWGFEIDGWWDQRSAELNRAKMMLVHEKNKIRITIVIKKKHLMCMPSFMHIESRNNMYWYFHIVHSNFCCDSENYKHKFYSHSEVHLWLFMKYYYSPLTPLSYLLIIAISLANLNVHNSIAVFFPYLPLPIIAEMLGWIDEVLES